MFESANLKHKIDKAKYSRVIGELFDPMRGTIRHTLSRFLHMASDKDKNIWREAFTVGTPKEQKIIYNDLLYSITGSIITEYSSSTLLRITVNVKRKSSSDYILPTTGLATYCHERPTISANLYWTTTI